MLPTLFKHADKLLRPGLQILAYSPAGLQQHLASHFFNLALKKPLAEGLLDFLDTATVRVEIRDLQQNWYFRLSQRRLRVESQGEETVCFSGELQSFLLMASQTVDPDTLFFRRQLSISGDTELGLALKNLLDSLELDQLPFMIGRPLQLYAQGHAG
ncbi:ubiquinone anaerobic biosynthesis accessory factor UbiT [Bowmanella dokdonensis]|uniref:Ubiquinone biosynthesis accessory factor UbiT n=1 Tax=Bowmanella dokdonensis TaxID=751969 RepID=A0A939DKH7_9ALTE|nr:SCP2 sterol-binding domain-containing protein [Bowmanella dokdonensis]MBN7824317.1 SCP2 sterol-binding domain-containing protein [Bowmanella dokdonensis]